MLRPPKPSPHTTPPTLMQTRVFFTGKFSPAWERAAARGLAAAMVAKGAKSHSFFSWSLGPHGVTVVMQAKVFRSGVALEGRSGVGGGRFA